MSIAALNISASLNGCVFVSSGYIFLLKIPCLMEDETSHIFSYKSMKGDHVHLKSVESLHETLDFFVCLELEAKIRLEGPGS